VGDALGQQLIKLLARPLRCRYSRGHGDASSCRRLPPATLGLGSKQECIPVSLSSKHRTSPEGLLRHLNIDVVVVNVILPPEKRAVYDFAIGWRSLGADGGGAETFIERS